MTLDNIVEEIKKANSIVVLTHENPDGDAIGSSLAMYNALKSMGKQVEVIIPKYAKLFEFLPGAEDILQEGTKTHYDLAISVDCATIKMLNGWVHYFENADVKICIDHHGTNTMYGDYNYVNPDAPACAQLLLVIFQYCGMEITKEMGSCILAGIITDTGGFKYAGVTAETFEFTAELLEKGVKVSDIYKRVLQTKTRPSFELYRIATNRIEFIHNNQITFTYLTLQDQIEVGAGEGDHEGIVEVGRDIEGVEVSIFARETEKGYRVSLRSNDYVNVSDVAMLFGGGGHPRAAGCTVSCSLEQVKESLVAETIKHLR